MNSQKQKIFLFLKQEYYFFSSSYGRTNSSVLYIATLDGGEFKTHNSVYMPCMSEQISIDDNGNLLIVFESDSSKYADNIFFNATTL